MLSYILTLENKLYNLMISTVNRLKGTNNNYYIIVA